MPSTSIPALKDTPSWVSMTALFVAFSCCKILLMPSYRSTDFDVHRNWLAITRHLPIKEWYYDDVNGTTVHTLDYPPSFAYWEYLLSNNPVTQYLIHDDALLDERCLQLLPDSDNTPSEACVIFHRSTVILSDIMLWWGAWVMATSSSPSQILFLGQFPASFLLTVFHPGLLWLDHVHFQYNGMLFGIFLASLGYLMKVNNSSSTEREFHVHHWKAAVLFALLLTMKHLFLTLGPFYFVYLLRRYCLEPPPPKQPPSQNSPLNSAKPIQLYPLHLITLSMYTGTTLLVPFLPFLRQMPQLLTRLFPFGRGLVHDYWAANVWALYSFVDKVLGLAHGPSLPDVPASVCALLLLLSLLPGLYFGAWKAAEEHDNKKLVTAAVYSALCSFMLGFHVHEKAILNAIIPLLFLVCNKNDNNTTSLRVLCFQMTALGLLGIFPLLFRPAEMALKLFSYAAYMALCYHVLIERINMSRQRLMMELLPLVAVVMVLVALLEFVPIRLYGKLEFLPLLCTSVGCAVGLILCWIRLLLWMVGMTAG
ncbi:Glc1Man9GlcNAc2 alpha-1,3-glucosyltransferase [Seminavis robusta]|uniref:Alpha-1,3-glucosyltransferase n=1 Tax=Seminavis robusta TaxID=568900 RepID=A0A9N8DIB6_9STRA|nr:Glc1Man9GlcNAc2 alpha-1,3-glucosyltransferase [Seminavis robusta]|eukprot:Sro101_g051710.1 Glc1Man9GlcNAc2 alpha-1,3-glucosyltransferase (536) ;mRNA; r:81979-83586